jgi:hypothetical protein
VTGTARLCCTGLPRPLRATRPEFRGTPSTRYRQQSLDQAGAALGDERFHRAYTRGMALSFDQAIDLVLGQVLPAT